MKDKLDEGLNDSEICKEFEREFKKSISENTIYLRRQEFGLHVKLCDETINVMVSIVINPFNASFHHQAKALIYEIKFGRNYGDGARLGIDSVHARLKAQGTPRLCVLFSLLVCLLSGVYVFVTFAATAHCLEETHQRDIARD